MTTRAQRCKELAQEVEDERLERKQKLAQLKTQYQNERQALEEEHKKLAENLKRNQESFRLIHREQNALCQESKKALEALQSSKNQEI
ncbi:hypothetical protein HPB47_018060 [Ixodes persulcatus]|uniref:Uncharacterized protein n=2 Tax=Ixodes persulcatus TaxID=34615 RepID=A0AC60P3C9_IXOPE|nr:hypothetical protein HPB47_008919 [Ixodes persulcatus]KAG0436246.1 hypothetical protein HPB47_018060 [Ixodes persulcatus]